MCKLFWWWHHYCDVIYSYNTAYLCIIISTINLS